VELVFDLYPTSNIFDEGHRIRVTITCADSDTFETPELSPPPTVSLYRNTEYASYITLPIIPAAISGPAGPPGPAGPSGERAAGGVALPIVAIILAVIAVVVVLIRRPA
jgi:hypothetical protein